MRRIGFFSPVLHDSLDAVELEAEDGPNDGGKCMLSIAHRFLPYSNALSHIDRVRHAMGLTEVSGPV